MGTMLQEYGKMIVIIIVIATLISVGIYFAKTTDKREINREGGKNEATTVNTVTSLNTLNEEGVDAWDKPWE